MSDTTYTVRAFPVSVKGVVVRDGRVLLRPTDAIPPVANPRCSATSTRNSASSP